MGPIVFGAQSDPEAAPASHELQLVVYPISDSEPEEHIVIVQGATHAYRTVKDLKAFMASLKDGSVVAWSTGCIKYTHLPVGSEKISIEALKAFAKSEGIVFKYYCGW